MAQPFQRSGLTNPPPASAPASAPPLVTATRFAPSPQRHTVDDFIARGCDGRLTASEADALKRRVVRAVSYYPAMMAQVWHCPVEWNAGLKSSAGRFVWGIQKGLAYHRIELHPGLRQEAPHHTQETFLHELAHAMAFWHHKKDCGHDVRWFEFMYLLAIDPLTHRTHNLPNCRHRSNVELSLADLELDPEFLPSQTEPTP